MKTKLREFSDALVRALRAQGLTKDQLARRLAMSPSAVGKWTGGTSEPAPDTVFAIEKALGMNPGSLSRLLGYCPCDETTIPSAWDAIMLDPTLPPGVREGLMGVFRSYRILGVIAAEG